MKIDFEKAVSLLRENNNILILTHANPDGDTIGSGFALMLALKKLNKNARVINNDAFPEKFGYITSLANVVDFKEEYIVSVDVADSKLLGKNIQSVYGEKVDLSVDHHATNKLFAKHTYVEAESASACEIIFKIIEALGVEIDKDMANCLFTGCSTDTGCFRYSSVTPQTHRIAARLIESGAQHSMINTVMFETKKLGLLKLQRLCIDSMEMCFGGKVCFFVITKEMANQTGCEESDYDAIIALSRQIEGVDVGITLKEKDDGTFKASVRTSENVDATVICSAFGGGGHKRASGCSFDCSAEEAKEKLKSFIGNSNIF